MDKLRSVMFRATMHLEQLDKLCPKVLDLIEAIADPSHEGLRKKRCKPEKTFMIGTHVGYLRGVAAALNIDIRQFLAAMIEHAFTSNDDRVDTITRIVAHLRDRGR